MKEEKEVQFEKQNLKMEDIPVYDATKAEQNDEQEDRLIEALKKV